MNSLTVLFGASFLAIALLAFTVQDYAIERRRVYRTLRTMRSSDLEPGHVRMRTLAVPLPQRILVPALRRLGGAIRRFTPSGTADRLRVLLLHAGSPDGWDAERLLAAKTMAGIAGVVLFPVLGAFVNLGGLRLVMMTVLGGALGYLLPEMLFSSKARARQESIRRALPDSLDLLTITVEAGLSFDAALARVARELGGPLGEEFHRVVQEMQLGEGRIESLRGLAERTSVPEMKEFVLAMVQADIFGISVANVLEVQAIELRTKRRQHAEEKAMKVPVKMIFPLVLFIMPATFIVLVGPAAMRLMSFF